MTGLRENIPEWCSFSVAGCLTQHLKTSQLLIRKRQISLSSDVTYWCSWARSMKTTRKTERRLPIERHTTSPGHRIVASVRKNVGFWIRIYFFPYCCTRFLSCTVSNVFLNLYEPSNSLALRSSQRVNRS